MRYFIKQVLNPNTGFRKDKHGKAQEKKVRITQVILGLILLFITVTLGYPYVRFYDGITVYGFAFQYGGDDQISEIVKGISDFDSEFGCPRHVSVLPMFAFEDEDNGLVLEESSPGRIKISPLANPHSVATHASVHACPPIFMFEDRIEYSDITIIGTSSLGFEILTPQGEDGNYLRAEEGFAQLVVLYSTGSDNLGIIGGWEIDSRYTSSMCHWQYLIEASPNSSGTWENHIVELWQLSTTEGVTEVAYWLFPEVESDRDVLSVYRRAFSDAWNRNYTC